MHYLFITYFNIELKRTILTFLCLEEIVVVLIIIFLNTNALDYAERNNELLWLTL